MPPSYGVGMVGYKFMGKAHSNAYRQVPAFFPDSPAPVMRALCGRDESAVKAAAAQFGWQGFETDWRKLVARTDIDIVDVGSPGDTHKEIAIGAAQAGKHVFCEKPLANTLSEAREMLQAVEAAGVKHMICFNYRFVPAVQLAKRIIADGRLGKIYHFRANFLQDWILEPDFPLVWRLQKEVAGSGALGDLGAHIIDLARYLVGDFNEVVGMTETFIKQRPLAEAQGQGGGLEAKGSQQMGDVTVDDASSFLARFENGALGTFEVTRFAPGHRCSNTFDISGSKGSIRWDQERLNELQVFFTSDDEDVQGFRTINVNEGPHPYGGVWWPGGHIIGYEHSFVHAVNELVNAINEDRQPSPNFADGVACQQILDAIEQSAESRQWVKIADV